MSTIEEKRQAQLAAAMEYDGVPTEKAIRKAEKTIDFFQEVKEQLIAEREAITNDFNNDYPQFRQTQRRKAIKRAAVNGTLAFLWAFSTVIWCDAAYTSATKNPFHFAPKSVLLQRKLSPIEDSILNLGIAFLCTLACRFQMEETGKDIAHFKKMAPALDNAKQRA